MNGVYDSTWLFDVFIGWQRYCQSWLFQNSFGERNYRGIVSIAPCRDYGVFIPRGGEACADRCVSRK
jgi:hypothetical protein